MILKSSPWVLFNFEILIYFSFVFASLAEDSQERRDENTGRGHLESVHRDAFLVVSTRWQARHSDLGSQARAQSAVGWRSQVSVRDPAPLHGLGGAWRRLWGSRGYPG